MEGDERMSVEDRLYTVRYRVDDKSHLQVRNPDVCAACPTKACEWFCPADVYTWEPTDQRLLIAYENCLECGTCRIACVEHNIEWVYPTGGYGIAYKFG
ncbi:ferredoxin family protein [Alicyclobacillus sp.]|uniref:ferredoxin family protein n=1 Tax=Alicyclobacillus sp. TaxID=61169 RepID=UPI0025B7ADD8|nr:4Fe-4S dicluster domain-containing protein [Alicyclobacillus sp.]MCL6517027.1 4Fe-4S dicluster domain-containing protein [Alicyclobacillus sp.]